MPVGGGLSARVGERRQALVMPLGVGIQPDGIVFLPSAHARIRDSANDRNWWAERVNESSHDSNLCRRRIWACQAWRDLGGAAMVRQEKRSRIFFAQVKSSKI